MAALKLYMTHATASAHLKQIKTFVLWVLNLMELKDLMFFTVKYKVLKGMY